MFSNWFLKVQSNYHIFFNSIIGLVTNEQFRLIFIICKKFSLHLWWPGQHLNYRRLRAFRFLRQSSPEESLYPAQNRKIVGRWGTDIATVSLTSWFQLYFPSTLRLGKPSKLFTYRSTTFTGSSILLGGEEMLARIRDFLMRAFCACSAWWICNAIIVNIKWENCTTLKYKW